MRGKFRRGPDRRRIETAGKIYSTTKRSRWDFSWMHTEGREKICRLVALSLSRSWYRITEKRDALRFTGSGGVEVRPLGTPKNEFFYRGAEREKERDLNEYTCGPEEIGEC